MKFRGRIIAFWIILLQAGLWLSTPPFPVVHKVAYALILLFCTFVLVAWLGFQYDKTRFLATHDVSTGLYNREYALSQLSRKLKKLKRGSSISVLIIDANNLKQLNDTYGHLAGDQGIRIVARALQSCISNHDIAGRLGGDEFIVIYSAYDRVDSEIMSNSIRYALQEQSKVTRFTMSVSIGIATYPDDADNMTDLMKIADARMYVQKYRYHASQSKDGDWKPEP